MSDWWEGKTSEELREIEKQWEKDYLLRFLPPPPLPPRPLSPNEIKRIEENRQRGEAWWKANYTKTCKQNERMEAALVRSGWLDRLPRWIAVLQLAWERRQRIRQARRAGVTRRVIAEYLDISQSAVAALERRCSEISPFEKWAGDQNDLLRLSAYPAPRQRRSFSADYWGA